MLSNLSAAHLIEHDGRTAGRQAQRQRQGRHPGIDEIEAGSLWHLSVLEDILNGRSAAFCNGTQRFFFQTGNTGCNIGRDGVDFANIFAGRFSFIFPMSSGRKNFFSYTFIHCPFGYEVFRTDNLRCF